MPLRQLADRTRSRRNSAGLHAIAGLFPCAGQATAPAWLSEVEDHGERLVDGALLGWGESAGETVEAFDVEGPELLDEYAGALAAELNLRAERRGGGAARGGRHDDRGEPKQLIGLDDYAVARAALLATAGGWQSDAVDLAADHSGQSLPTASISAMTALRSRVSCGSATSRRTSSASSDRRLRLRAASTRAVRTASDSLRPSRISTDSALSDASSKRALTTREATRRL